MRIYARIQEGKDNTFFRPFRLLLLPGVIRISGRYLGLSHGKRRIQVPGPLSAGFHSCLYIQL